MDLFYVLPLKVLTTQALLLLVAIAIEAFFIQQQMQCTPRKSIEYSASVNLLSTVIGWFSFFLISGNPVLPATMRLQVLNFVIFGNWETALFTWVVSLGFVTFLGVVVVEAVGFNLLQRLLNEQAPPPEKPPTQKRSFTRPSIRPQQLVSGLSEQSDVLAAILISNVISSVVIVVLLIALQITSAVR